MDRFVEACNGRSESRGGMNLSEFKQELSRRYKNMDFNKMKRTELESWCKKQKDIVSKIKKEDESYFLKDAKIPEKHKSYCRCIAHVSAKNTDECYESGDWKKYRKGRSKSPSRGSCVNPYAVCRKQIGSTGLRNCLQYMDLDKMPKKELAALAKMKGVSIPKLKQLAEAERSRARK